MRALLIHQAFVSPNEPGGTRHYELAKYVVKKGAEFTIVASNINYITGKPVQSTNGLYSKETIAGVSILRSYMYPRLHRSYVFRTFSFISFAFTSIYTSLRGSRPDVVMGTSPPIFQSLSAWIVSYWLKKPFVFEVRDLWPEFAIDIGILRNSFLILISRSLESFLYARAKKIVVNSPAYRDYLLQKGIRDSKIEVIPNGADENLFDHDNLNGHEVRKNLNLNGKYVVTYTGALGLANDIQVILRAAKRLSTDPRVQFLLVGDGKERANLVVLSQRLGLSNVTFAGIRAKTEIRDILSTSDVCIATLKDIPMFRTTYPNKVFEYMAAGRPTILAIDGAIRNVIEDAQCGIFVPPGDDKALAEAVLSFANGKEPADEMGRAGRKYVVAHFSRKRQADKLLKLLKNAANSTPLSS